MLRGTAGHEDVQWNGAFRLLWPWTLADVALGPQGSGPEALVATLGLFWLLEGCRFSAYACAVHPHFWPWALLLRLSLQITALSRTWPVLWGEAPPH